MNEGASAHRVVCLGGDGVGAREKDMRGTKTDAFARRRKLQRAVVAVDSTRRSKGSAKPGRPGEDTKGPEKDTHISKAVTGSAMDSELRSGVKPSSAADWCGVFRRIVGMKCLERTRRPTVARVKVSEDCDSGGGGMKCLERCRTPRTLRMNGEESWSQDELCAQDGRGITRLSGSVAQRLKSGAGLKSWKEKERSCINCKHAVRWSTFVMYPQRLNTLPFDLLIFSRLDRECRKIVLLEGLFQRSLTRISAPCLDPAVPLPGLIDFLFNTSSCWRCGKLTDSYPLSFSLHIRVCDDQCKKDLYGGSSCSADLLVTIPFAVNLKGDDLLLEKIWPWAPFLESSNKNNKVYNYHQLTSAITQLSDALRSDGSEGLATIGKNGTALLQEWSRRAANLPALMDVLLSLPFEAILNVCQSAYCMLSWQKTYLKERKKCASSNEKRLKRMFSHHGLARKEQYVYRSPTLIRTLDLYNKDLEMFTFHAFETIASKVYSEIWQMQEDMLRTAAVRLPKPLKPSANACSAFLRIQSANTVFKSFSSTSRKHPDDFPKARKDLRASNPGRFCLLCPQSMKQYCAEGLSMHHTAKSVDSSLHDL
ncbi:hypothetical protein C8R43DRAFT_952387 [Mycena crocata]|nr:hypothetical protein C8R43DRAFT_952387 [Mycena crocata]